MKQTLLPSKLGAGSRRIRIHQRAWTTYFAKAANAQQGGVER
ncbi:MAG: hypothetical protein ACLU9L_05160 [Christensenellales bacterium]